MYLFPAAVSKTLSGIPTLKQLSAATEVSIGNPVAVFSITILKSSPESVFPVVIVLPPRVCQTELFLPFSTANSQSFAVSTSFFCVLAAAVGEKSGRLVTA